MLKLYLLVVENHIPVMTVSSLYKNMFMAKMCYRMRKGFVNYCGRIIY